jgi:hypothetical protein
MVALGMVVLGLVVLGMVQVPNFLYLYRLSEASLPAYGTVPFQVVTTRESRVYRGLQRWWIPIRDCCITVRCADTEPTVHTYGHKRKDRIKRINSKSTWIQQAPGEMIHDAAGRMQD